MEPLIKRAKAKDAHALETLYKMYYPKMLGLCINITKEGEDTAKDLVHDAFVLAFSALQSLNAPERFGEWLTSIVRNVSLRYLERKKKVNFVSIAGEYDLMADKADSPEAQTNRQDILNLINKLPDGYGKVFRLYVIDGFSHKEIADILGIEAHSSSSQLARAKALLRKMIDRRFMAVVLFLIMAVPLYFHISREKQPQPQNHHIAEKGTRRKNADTDRAPQPGKEETDVQKLVRKPLVASAVHKEKDKKEKNTIQTPDTTAIETVVPDVQVARQETDSMAYTDSIPLQISYPEYELTHEEAKKKSGKWQMLAGVAGSSLGPTLVQDIYRLMATGNAGDIGSDGSPMPANVRTWEEYSEYLHRTEHEHTPKDTLALMEIADHNRGDIIEQEQHDRPITFGISLSKPLSKRWSVETGLQYSLLKSSSKTGGEDYYIGKKQKIHYLGIPLRLTCRIVDYKRLSAYGSAGLSLNIPVYGKATNKQVLANVAMDSTACSVTIRPPVQWSTNFSLGVQYRILPKMTLYVEPTLYWHIPNGSSTHTYWTEHPVMFSVPAGVRITW